MSYGMMRPMSGLGEEFTTTLKTPFGDQKFAVDVPYEQMMQQAMQAAAAQGQAAALPLIQSMLPQLMNIALPILSDYMEDTFWPNVAKPLFEAEIKKVEDRATKKAAIAGGIAISALMLSAFFIIRRR